MMSIDQVVPVARPNNDRNAMTAEVVRATVDTYPANAFA